MPIEPSDKDSRSSVEASPPAVGAVRRWLRIGRALLTAAVLALLGLGVLGQLLRDRPVPLGLLLYLPLLPLGLWAIVQDLLLAGRCLPRPRFGLALIGLVVAVWSAASLTAFGTGREEHPERPVVRLLHWNVRWGGKPWSWPSVLADIQARTPDIVVLSESPGIEGGWPRLLEDHPGWSGVSCENEKGSPYWYRLVVCSRWPVRKEYDRAITNGHVMSVVIEAPDRPLRLLVVDGESDPWLSRTAMLDEVVALCRGAPVDLLAGDFNTPRRSLGFDAFAEVAGGYRLSSGATWGWRGTYPADCPLYDIDHVWLGSGFAIRDCELFGHEACDHRGQVVAFYLPAKAGT